MVDRSLVDMLTGLRTRITLVERRLARRGGGAVVVEEAGRVAMTARSTAPEGWLICAGQSLLRSEYPELFTAIGTTYGAADASHFSVPDLRGRVAAGRDATQTEFDVLGEKGGAKTHTLTAAEMPQHNHGFTYGGNFLNNTLSGGGTFGSFVNWVLGNSAYAAPANQLGTAVAGSNGAHNNLQPYIALNYMIKT